MKLIEAELQDVLSKDPSGDDLFVPRVLVEEAISELNFLRNALEYRKLFARDEDVERLRSVARRGNRE